MFSPAQQALVPNRIFLHSRREIQMISNAYLQVCQYPPYDLSHPSASFPCQLETRTICYSAISNNVIRFHPFSNISDWEMSRWTCVWDSVSTNSRSIKTSFNIIKALCTSNKCATSASGSVRQMELSIKLPSQMLPDLVHCKFSSILPLVTKPPVRLQASRTVCLVDLSSCFPYQYIYCNMKWTKRGTTRKNRTRKI